MLDADDLVNRSAVQGRTLVNRINALRDRHDILNEVRGLGCLVAIELKPPKGGTRKMVWRAMNAAHESLFPQMVVMPLLQKHYILTQVTGSHGSIIRLMPPYVITDDDITWFVDALDDVLTSVHRVVRPAIGLGRNALRAKWREKTRPG